MIVKEPDTRQLTWNGCGRAISKVISCAEIMKRQFKVCGNVCNNAGLCVYYAMRPGFTKTKILGNQDFFGTKKMFFLCLLGQFLDSTFYRILSTVISMHILTL